MKAIILLSLCIAAVFASDDYPNAKAYESYQTPESHHPSFIVYDETKKGLKSLNTPLLGSWKNAVVVGDLLENGKIVCGSCHVSNSTKYSSPDETRELRVENSFSTLCLSCHDK